MVRGLGATSSKISGPRQEIHFLEAQKLGKSLFPATIWDLLDGANKFVGLKSDYPKLLDVQCREEKRDQELFVL